MRRKKLLDQMGSLFEEKRTELLTESKMKRMISRVSEDVLADLRKAKGKFDSEDFEDLMSVAQKIETSPSKAGAELKKLDTDVRDAMMNMLETNTSKDEFKMIMDSFKIRK